MNLSALLNRTSGGSLRIQLLRGSLGAAAAKGCYIVLQFAGGVLLARLMGPEALGVYTVAIALAQILAVPAQFGFPSSLIRTIARLVAQDDKGSVRNFVLGSAEIIIALCLIITIIAAITYSSFEYNFALSPYALALALLLVPLQALSATLSAAVRALGFVVESQFATEVARSAVLLLILGGWATWNTVAQPEQALFFNVVAVGCSLVLVTLTIRKRLPSGHSGAAHVRPYKRLLIDSIPFVLLAGVQVVNYQTNVIILSLMASREAIGLYRVALQLTDGMGVFLYAISIAIAPAIARLQADEDWSRLRKILIQTHLVSVSFMLPLGLLMFVLSNSVVTVVYGEEYSGAAAVLKILSVSKIMYAAVCFSGLMLSMMGKPYVAAAISLCAVLLNVSLNILLIPYYGIEGAAFATGVSEFFTNAVGVFYLGWFIRNRKRFSDDRKTGGSRDWRAN